MQHFPHCFDSCSSVPTTDQWAYLDFSSSSQYLFNAPCFMFGLDAMHRQTQLSLLQKGCPLLSIARMCLCYPNFHFTFPIVFLKTCSCWCIPSSIITMVAIVSCRTHLTKMNLLYLWHVTVCTSTVMSPFHDLIVKKFLTSLDANIWPKPF